MCEQGPIAQRVRVILWTEPHKEIGPLLSLIYHAIGLSKSNVILNVTFCEALLMSVSSGIVKILDRGEERPAIQ